jgi:hypothetical protein
MHGQIVGRSQSIPTNVQTTVQISAFVPLKPTSQVSDNYNQYDTGYRQSLEQPQKRRDSDKPTTASRKDRLVAESARSLKPSYDSQTVQSVRPREPSYDSSFPILSPPMRKDTDSTLVGEPEPLFTSPFDPSSPYSTAATPPSFRRQTPKTPRTTSIPYTYTQQPISQERSSNSISSRSTASSRFGSTSTSRESRTPPSTPPSSPPQSPTSQIPQIKKSRTASSTTKPKPKSRSFSFKDFADGFGLDPGLMAGVSPITDHRAPPVVEDHPPPPMPPPLQQEQAEGCPEGKRRPWSKFINTFGQSKALEEW